MPCGPMARTVALHSVRRESVRKRVSVMRSHNNTGMPHPSPDLVTACAVPAVVLCTLNARYLHASLGLRYLLANMGVLRSQTVLREFTIARQPADMARELLALLGPPGSRPPVQVVGFGVYIWNVTQTCALVQLLRTRRPELKIVLGGPEVSHELDTQEIVRLADHVITGWGDLSFPRLCQGLLHGPRPLTKVIAGEQAPLAEIALPYDEYTDADLAHRVVYVEASRGCPFKCAFCLSALDRTAWAFDLQNFLGALDRLYRRGARNFKFVDRTFNLKLDAALQILQFFLDRLPVTGDGPGAQLFVHFEVIPDHLPERLKQRIALFPPGVLQFEVGVQTFDTAVQQRLSRVQDNLRTEANLRWLVSQSRAHFHADLIFGLPGESMGTFGQGFDRLLALGPHEIQLGVLKRLRGTPLATHGAPGDGMVFDPLPPYTVLETACVSADDVRRFGRLARYWELIANSGRFRRTLPMLLQAPGSDDAAPGSAFAAMLRLTDWLWARTGRTDRLTPEQLVDHLAAFLRTEQRQAPDLVAQVLLADYLASGARARPQALQGLLSAGATPIRGAARASLPRQSRHLVGPVEHVDTAAQMAATGSENRL